MKGDGFWSMWAVVIIFLALAFWSGWVAADLLVDGDCQVNLGDVANVCAEPYLVTPRCDDDDLAWPDVPDVDLDRYRVIERTLDLVIVAMWDTAVPLIRIGCRTEDVLIGVSAIDLAGNLSVDEAACIWRSRRTWDCVSDSRPECEPGACTFFCDAWATCEVDGRVFTCCGAGHLEPEGCTQCMAPIGGVAVWVMP